MKKILIIGGMTGGASAAARLRRLSEEDEIILFERSGHISYAGCGLPYYIGDVIGRRQALFAETAPGLAKRYRLDIRCGSEVLSINRDNKSVLVQNLETGETYEERYDKLILSPGSRPAVPELPGMDAADNAFTLKEVRDADALKKACAALAPERAVVIGGGFAGVEMAENLSRLGLAVTIVEKRRQLLGAFDFEMAQILHRTLNAHGVGIILEDGASRFENEGRILVLESGRALECDLAVLTTGVKPESGLARRAGLRVNEAGYIVTTQTYAALDADLLTPVDGIYAIGDAIQVQNFVDKQPYAAAHAGPASRQGRVLADHLAGLPTVNNGLQGTSILKIFDQTAAVTGNNVARLKKMGISYQEVHAHRLCHAGYYPGASLIDLKLIYDPKTLKILGAQAVGKEGVDKRIDVISTAMRLGATIRNLACLELCYAPPYSTVKDPVNILGTIAGNISEGIYKTIGWDEVDGVVAEGGFLLDVTTPQEYENGHIDGAVNIELDALRERLDELPQERELPLYVYCLAGQRAYTAIRLLRGCGYNNLYLLSGGYATYCDGRYQPDA
ncbi:FAD-dependent oxidoreductase [Eubacterium sp. 1001713B170207_170306_E7]|uniref:FAD-dependent oxidoreductase n=1 Tax=Eubacterium sp. 1001713B170207_170306_E7 TaxID=2787097 RepID=UPI0018998742|nr:FAD-dependent oxidoreductase [Eubacterium sp. 1001713B170207_170306_E7]